MFGSEQMLDRPASDMNDPHAIKVVLRTLDGMYLAGHQQEWLFTEMASEATVFNYVGDHIPEQLDKLEREHGLVLLPVPVDPHERYEVCDRCGRRVMSFKVFFDGQQYLCPDCRAVGS